MYWKQYHVEVVDWWTLIHKVIKMNVLIKLVSQFIHLMGSKRGLLHYLVKSWYCTQRFGNEASYRRFPWNPVFLQQSAFQCKNRESNRHTTSFGKNNYFTKDARLRGRVFHLVTASTQYMEKIGYRRGKGVKKAKNCETSLVYGP